MLCNGETCYCDHCGDLIYADSGDPNSPRSYVQYKPYRIYTHVPWNVDSANKGESAVLCLECVQGFEEDDNELPD